MPHLIDCKGPAVARVRTVRIACGYSYRSGLDGGFHLLKVLRRVGRLCLDRVGEEEAGLYGERQSHAKDGQSMIGGELIHAASWYIFL